MTIWDETVLTMVANGVANMEQAFYEEDHYEDFTIKLLCVMFEMLPVFLKSGRLRAFLGNLFENRLLLLLSVHTQ